MKTTLVLLLLPLFTYAQSKDINYLVVRGQAEVQVPVDFFEVSLSITTRGPSFQVANDSNRALTLKVLDLLKGFAIPDSDFQTVNNSSSDQEYVPDPTRRLSVHYGATLMLRRPNLYDSLFQSLVRLGNVAVTITNFRSNHLPYYRMLAYQKAVDAARHEAELMLQGSHQTLGKIIKLIQDNRDVFSQYDDIDKILSSSWTPNLQAVSVSSQRTLPINIIHRDSFIQSGEVTVIFEIK